LTYLVKQIPWANKFDLRGLWLIERARTLCLRHSFIRFSNSGRSKPPRASFFCQTAHVGSGILRALLYAPAPHKWHKTAM
jgi:hypothetical protein